MKTRISHGLFSKYAGIRRRRYLHCRDFLKWSCRFIRRQAGTDRAAVVLFEPHDRSLLLAVSEYSGTCEYSAGPVSSSSLFGSFPFHDAREAENPDYKRLHELFHQPGRWTEILVHGRPAGLLFCGERKKTEGYTSAFQMILDQYADDIAAVLEKEDYFDAHYQDFLTGLLHRSVLEERLDRMTGRCKAWNVHVGVILMQVESRGRISGFQKPLVEDQLMRYAGGCVRANLRQTDLAFRYDTNRFLALVPMVPRNPERNLSAEESRKCVASIGQRLADRLAERPVYCHGVCIQLDGHYGSSILDPEKSISPAVFLEGMEKEVVKRAGGLLFNAI